MKGNTMSWFAKLMAMGLLTISVAFAAEPQTATLDVKNMQCQMCAITVKKALQKVPGVEEAKVKLDQKNATVRFDPNKTSPDALAAATTKAGFPATVHK
jgi:mercuric ion binding protein